uniref:Reverse transcriptase domain-containing protein n=1 Tax=Neogobius melanostomus TaxID=47308 RepID=A0A8C6SR27_9GOBI
MWLQNQEFVKYVENKIDIYFETNIDQTNASVRWEAFKAYIRGEIISFTSTKSKKQKAEITKLEKEIKSLEIDINKKDDLYKQKRLLALRAEYNKLTSDKAAKGLLWLNQAFYDQGEKAGKLLAWRIKKMKSERAINGITTQSGGITNDPQDINIAFQEFYQSLYRSECSADPANRDAFLDQLPFQVLTEEVKKDLDNDITAQELLQAIKCVNSGKVPGPDGLPIEFYKTFQNQLLTPLLNMFNESFLNGILPPTLRLATIILTLKPGKIPTDCSSYRPISLMGVDTKILCKVLAKRLDPHIPSLVHNDQNGFVKSRQGFHNIRRVLNIIHCNNNTRDAALLSLDARQAFDRIEWPYLFNVLPRYGIGGNFLKWVQLLYTGPMASVLTNNNLSSQITLERSTRQGCPLSPLLFILAIEPLAISIRNEVNLSGITIGDQEHRISLYADDVILFLSKLETSIPAILQVINKFGQFSGYSINDTKSSILFLNNEERNNPIINLPFFNATEGFTYLGIKITPQINTIVSANYDPLMGEVRESIEKWTTMPISMIGRINLIKMAILPKFLYLFQSLPLPLPKSFFKEINAIFSRFIWNNRKSRLRFKLLYLPYDRGGLQMPCLQWYYWAAQLRSAMFYFSTQSPPAWVSIEQTISKLPLKLYIYSSKVKSLRRQVTNPFLKNSINTWYKAHEHVGDMPSISQFSPIWGNTLFTPGRADGGFKIWADKGVQKIGDLYEGGALLTFNDLCLKYSIPPKHFFKYLQLKHFISSHCEALREPPLSCLEDIMIKHGNGKRQISVLYAALVSHDKESSSDRMRAWSLDIKEDIDEDEWSIACLKAQTQTINTRMKLLQHKWLMRTYMTPEKLNKFSPDIPDTCVKCSTEKGTLIHCVWECPKLVAFWKLVVCTLSRIVKLQVPCTPKLCILGIYPKNFTVNTKHKTLINFGLLQARRMVALSWKETELSSTQSWLREMTTCITLERLTYITKGKAQEFEEVWTPLTDFLKK